MRTSKRVSEATDCRRRVGATVLGHGRSANCGSVHVHRHERPSGPAGRRRLPWPGREFGAREAADTMIAETTPSAHSSSKPQVRLPDVQPGDRPADEHPLDLRRALEDGEDRGPMGSFHRSATCRWAWYQHGSSTRFPSVAAVPSDCQPKSQPPTSSPASAMTDSDTRRTTPAKTDLSPADRHPLAGAGGPGEGHHVDALMAGDRFADHRPGAVHDVDDARRDPRGRGHLGEQGGGERGDHAGPAAPREFLYSVRDSGGRSASLGVRYTTLGLSTMVPASW